MKLNQVTPKTIKRTSDSELLNLHFRTHQLASPFFRRSDNTNPKLQNIVVRHKLIVTEMIRRGIRFKVSDELDRLAYPDVEEFLDRFAKTIPSQLSELPKNELVKLHNQLHSVWEVIHLRDVSVTQQEQLWNWHRLVERALEDRGTEVPQNWDSLDRPLGRAIQTPGTSRTNSSGEERGPWIFIEELTPYIPKEITVVENAILIDVDKGLIWLTDIGGRQLIKVMYFRILRQFPRDEWSKFRTASMEELESVDVAYDLTLRKLEPLMTVQLSLQFDDLCLVKPYLYIVGGVATQGASKNDVDILLRKGVEPELEQKIYSAFTLRFPEQIRSRFSQVEDSGLAPFTSYVGVCSLDLARSFHSDVNIKPAEVDEDNVDAESDTED